MALAVSALSCVLMAMPAAAQAPGRPQVRRPLPRMVAPATQTATPRPRTEVQPVRNYAPQQAMPYPATGQSMGQPGGQPAPIQRMPARSFAGPQSANTQQQGYAQPETPQRLPVQTAQPQNRSLIVPNRPGESQQHLAGWMEAHRSLPLAQQQRALENEPGFRSYSPQEQQRMRDRLTQLNSMPPQQRQKVIERTEAMERLAPPQRQQVRNAMAQLGNLPEERRHVVSRTFYQLRDLPPQQRQAYMNSPQFRGQFTDQERGTISGLLEVTPIYPPLQSSAPPR